MPEPETPTKGKRKKKRERRFYWPRLFRILTQTVFVLVFFLTLALMTEAGLRYFPVQWLFHLNPLPAVALLASSWVMPVAFLWSLAVVGLTVLFGRAFCGWVCPVGSMNQVIAWTTRRLRRGRPDKINRWRPHFRLKYLFLIGLVAVALAGSLQIGLLDPISLAARSFASGLLPAARSLVNPEGLRPDLASGAWLTAVIFLVLLTVNRWIVRWWCRALCPLGAMLGLISRAAIYRIQVDPDKCTHCNLCARDCQGADEPFDEHRVSECHVCLNCVSECGEGAIAYLPFVPASSPSGGVRIERRQLIGSLAAGAALWPLLRASSVSAASPGPHAIRPPGSVPEEEFTARCIRCGACSNACPTSAIQPALGEAGAEGLWSPIVIPRLGWCEPSCVLCGQICPTEAIQPITAEEKGWVPTTENPVRIGTAFFDRGRCLPWGMNTPCIVCQEVCPTSPKAIWLEEVVATGRDGKPVKLQRPYMDPDLCVGCGLCEAKCPVKDVAAVRVTRIGESRSPESSFTLAAPGNSP